MKAISIDIYKTDILNEVIKTTAYVGAKQSAEGVDLYDKVFLSDAKAEYKNI